MGQFKRRDRLNLSVVLVLLALAVLVALAGFAPAAMADPTYTWSGGSALSSGASATQWSQSANWSGTAPPSETEGSFVFPALNSTSCPATGATNACYQGFDDEDPNATTPDPVTIDGLTLSGTGYDISGSAINATDNCLPPDPLGSGGITEIATGAPLDNTLELPLDPVGAQNWTLTGNGTPASAILHLENVASLCQHTADATSLTVNATDGAVLDLDGGDELGLTFRGSGPDGAGPDGALLDVDSILDGGNGPVTVNDASAEFDNSESGGFTASNSANVIFDGTSSVGSSTAGSSTLTFDIGGSAQAVGTGGELKADSGSLTLTNSALALQWNGSANCPDETQAVPDETFTLVQTDNDGLEGTFTDAANGSVFTMNCTSTGPNDPPPQFEINYAPTTAPLPDSVTATLLPSTTTSGLSVPTTPTAVDQPVTLSATVALGATEFGQQSIGGYGTVEFDMDGAPIPGCTGLEFASYNGTTGDGTADCSTAFTTADSGALIVAKFDPATGVSPSPAAGYLLAAPSSSSTATLPTITKDSTTINFGGSQTVTAGTPVTLNAYVDPAIPATPLETYVVPTGNVVFMNGSTPITCGGVGDNALTSVDVAGEAHATCTTTFAFSGTIYPTLQYAGDANFTVASGGPPTVTITSPASGGTYTIGQVVPTAFTCVPPTGTGVLSCVDGANAPSPGTLDTADAGAHSYTVTGIGSTGEVATATIKYTVVGPPTVSITAPASGGQYTAGEHVPTAFACADPQGPGIATCLDGGGATSPAKLDTSTVGAHSYTVTATSTDGQKATRTINYAVVAAIGVATLTPGAAKVTGTTASVPLTCAGAAGAACQAKLVVSVVETLRGDKLVAVTAQASKAKQKPKTKKVVVLASRTITIAAGQKLTVKLSLNATGKRLLAQHSPLTAKLAITVGSTTVPSTVTFRVPKAKTKRKHNQRRSH